MREGDCVVLTIHRELDPFQVKGVAVENFCGSVDNGLPNAGGELVDTTPLLMRIEITEGLGRMCGELLVDCGMAM